MPEGPVVRFDPAVRLSKGRDPWEAIHLARYVFALSCVPERRVLDVACGTGYGLSVLRSRARTAIGVDVDFTALRKAPAVSGGGGSVVAADGRRLPFADGAFEAVTSFETLEHLEQRQCFIAELRRVLHPEGLLILSTPNANYTEPIDGTPRNPHHVHEYRPSELRSELEERFKEVVILGQILSRRIQISPFTDDHRRLPGTARAQARLLLWRVLNKLPPAAHDRLSRLLWGHALIAGENDYEFREDSCERAPVLVALCRGEQSR